MEAKVYNQQGKESGKINLPEEIFGLPWNADLVHQVVVAMAANKRTPVAHTKSRADVRGGGKKPWKQKGTGRARHGSTRSPIWVGGGVTFGPRNDKDYSQKINRKMKDKALFSVLSKKWKDGEVLFVDKLSFAAPKTKDAKTALQSLSSAEGFSKLSTTRKNAFYLALDTKEKNTAKSFSNFSNGFVDEVRNLNPKDLLSYKYLIVVDPEKAISFLSGKKILKKASKKTTKAK